MEGTMAEIRLFAGDFAPKSWNYCSGQLLSIASNQALFSLLGTTYGGNGIQSFGLPDLRGRIPVGPGQGPGLSNYLLGTITGTENVTLMQTQIPQHTHQAIVQQGGGLPIANVTLNGVNGVGGETTPEGNYLGSDDSAAASQYAASGTPVPMNSSSVKLNDVTVSTPNVQVSISGNTQSHTNIQPSLVLNYIICVYGIFPSRN